MYNLKDKLLNADDDVSDKTIFNTDVIKQLSGGSEYIRGEKKNQQAVLFLNTAKLMFAGNEVPPTFKNDKAYINRWAIFVCSKIHKPKDKGFIKKKELLASITELDYSIFIKECLDAFRLVYKKGEFTLSKSNQDINRKYQMLSNPLALFIEECTQPEGFEVKSIFLNAYNIWAVKNNARAIDGSNMGRKMKGKFGLGYTDARETLNQGSKISYWEDISLTNEARQEFINKKKSDENSKESKPEALIKVTTSSEKVDPYPEGM
jgi:putative DNA primase/helicase